MNWTKLTVSPDSTHHLREGLPAYAPRFDCVQKFHSPGLAPVTAAGCAWHIRTNGEPAYEPRYLQSFGFYGELAAVQDGTGWFHIRPDGEAAYAERYDWCGNFQDGLCPVRTPDNRYVHILVDGRRSTDSSWRYAGDYRNGIAVVQRDDGLSSHVDSRGNLVHRLWFQDLDVFHKGYARAKDLAGWFHIQSDGRAIYSRRFAMVEPFYNGQARVETHGGALEVIDEQGNTLVKLRPSRQQS